MKKIILILPILLVACATPPSISESFDDKNEWGGTVRYQKYGGNTAIETETKSEKTMSEYCGGEYKVISTKTVYQYETSLVIFSANVPYIEKTFRCKTKKAS